MDWLLVCIKKSLEKSPYGWIDNEFVDLWSFYRGFYWKQPLSQRFAKDFAFKKKLAHFSKQRLCSSLIPSKGLLISVAVSHIHLIVIDLLLHHLSDTGSWAAITSHTCGRSSVEDHRETKSSKLHRLPLQRSVKDVPMWINRLVIGPHGGLTAALPP